MADPLPAAAIQGGDVALAAAPPFARYSLRTRDPVGLPARLSAASFGGGTALWLGPDEWLLLLPQGSAAPDGMFATTDIGHRNVALAVTGEGAAALIQTGVALDLSLAAFPAGKVTRTVFEGVEIVLWRTAADRFHIEVWRSFARHLWDALALAAGDR